MKRVTAEPTCGDAADDLVAGDHGEEHVAPLAADLVDVGVADAAVVDGEDDVVGVGVAAVKGPGTREAQTWRQRRSRRISWGGLLGVLLDARAEEAFQ